MSFVVNPKREVKFYHKIEENGEVSEFSVTFKFIIGEDVDYVMLRDKSADKTPLEIEDEHGKITKTEMGTYNAFLYTLRISLIDCSDIIDPDGKEIKIKDEHGKIIEENQIAVFEAIRIQKELFDKIVSAYIGEKEKN